jgi:hypothetical protein
MTTRITNAVNLKSVAATLHDARFTADAIKFDAATHTFDLKCWVLEPKPKADAAARRWQACRLSFANVVDCKVNAKEKVRYYELATIRFSERDRKLDLVTHYAIEISLAVGELDGTLTETSETRDKWDAPVKHLSTA